MRFFTRGYFIVLRSGSSCVDFICFMQTLLRNILWRYWNISRLGRPQNTWVMLDDLMSRVNSSVGSVGLNTLHSALSNELLK